MKYCKPVKRNSEHKLLILLLVLCFSQVLSAQKFRGGLYAGMIASQIDGDGLAGFDMAGLNVGGFTYFPVGKHSKIQMEIGLAQRGSREPNSDSSNFFRWRLNYIQIPVFFNYRWNNLSFEAGPGLDIFVQSRQEVNGRVTDQFGDAKLLNLFFFAGVNYHFTDKFSINFRSGMSSFPISDGIRVPGDPFILGFAGRGMRNSWLSFALVYDFLGD